MSMNVYNIIWADDEIDALLEDEDIEDLKSQGFNIVGKAHNGVELEKLLMSPETFDAVIIDANFNESNNEVSSERDTSGLTYARILYKSQLKEKVPFFLFTGRSDEQLKERYQYVSDFQKDFPRHKRWFNKGQNEWDEMFNEIKNTVDNMRTPYFIVRNRYVEELNAASLFDDVYTFVLDFLIRDYNNDFEDYVEPFITVRRKIEKIFAQCEEWGIIPPISDNTNGTAAYFLHNKYRIKDTEGKVIYPYQMLVKDIMPKPLAHSLNHIVEITQDASHSKDKMKLKIDEYFNKTKDILLLRSVIYIFLDVLKWFARTLIEHQDKEVNKITLWGEV